MTSLDLASITKQGENREENTQKKQASRFPPGWKEKERK
jgi:hypothetical protein